ncbi:MAG: nucleotidyl transferase AbiEii/AbiGii toxin family protein [Chloroflexota bacterium]
MSLHPEVLRTAQTRVLRQFGPVLTERRFYLAGGTAVAIHLGHRRSVDLGWFCQESIPDPLLLAQGIREAGVPFRTGRVDRGTLDGVVAGVRVSLLEYRYPLLEATIPWDGFGCLLASLADLACMKLAAVAQRGAKKDFVDVYALGLRYRPLQGMLHLYTQKYSVSDIAHLLYGLTYFDDADRERMPRMLWRTNWSTIKQTIREWVRDVVAET